ncbi:hypothetical protein [Hugenholtzia roseola]|uniref:hypothetical protein n=1 Tax=Hugenholtzia roseola TaxID=1002 RepID=UPI0003FFEBA0|nr:hypothetical protein [Hugenholtzia roseola]
MNYWKIAFWSCLALLVAVTCFAAYAIIDQAYTLTYQKVGYEDTEKDLEELMEIVSETNLSKKQIIEKLKNDSHFDFADFKADTISLNRILLIFEDDKLKKVTKQW